LIVSNRRERVSIKKDVVQTASVFTQMVVGVLNTFSYVSGETHQYTDVVIEQYSIPESFPNLVIREGS